jgi:signal transduction histidine kinase/ligand-binding sensor domain-containing protein
MFRISFLLIRIFFILFLISFSFLSVGQRVDFRFYSYNKENKLSEELVKSSQQDSLGVYYFATDGGVLFLENDRFNPVDVPEGNSCYFKEIFRRRNGDLLAVSDDAIYQIQRKSEKVSLKLFIECNISVSKPKYPKHLFEDQNNNLWIADYKDIFLYKEGKIEKFAMPEKNRTSSYARTFQFLEFDRGQLLVVAQSGWIYRFDENQNKFIESDIHLSSSVFASIKIHKNEFLLASSNGIVKLSYQEESGELSKELISSSISASCFHRLSDTKLLVGTWFQGLIELDLSDDYQLYPVGGFPYYTVNDIFLDRYGKYWAATNSGVVILEKKFFSYQLQADNSEYICSINLSSEGKVRFSGRNQVYEVDELKQVKSMGFQFDGSIDVCEFYQDYTFLGTEQGDLFVYKNKELVSKLSISDHAITSIKVFSEEMVYLVADKELFKLNLKTGLIKSYLKEFKGQRIIQNIQLSDLQKLYIGAENKHSYLFQLDFATDKITNLSVPTSFKISDDFWVRDMKFDGDTLYLGTSGGLLKYVNDSIQRMDLGNMTNSEVNSVAIDQNHSIWLTTSKGVVRKRENDISLFTPDHGLPSKTFTTRNLLIDSTGYLWVGTSNGIAYANISDSILPTPQPVVHLTDSEGKLLACNELLSMTANSMLLLDVSASIYPQKQNQFEYCITQISQKATRWKKITAKNQILTSKLKSGKYKIYIRGKHEGNYKWSEPRVIQLDVSQVWYLRWYALFSVFLIILSLIFLTNYYSKKRTEKNLLELEKIVSDRTLQLRNANDELSDANRAKDKFMSIIAHDLRNPFNAIRGFSRILLQDKNLLSPEERKELVETIFRSSNDTYKLLESLLEWANVQKGNFKLKPETFDLKEILDKNVSIHNSLASLKNLSVSGDFESVEVNADKDMIDTVIRNLLSNAIKYSFPDKSIRLTYEISKNLVVVRVRDEGVGMSQGQVDKLFKIDMVSTSEGTAHETGTGFGLMLSKEFVEMNGGKIWVESEKDKGTSFYFSIPIATI